MGKRKSLSSSVRNILLIVSCSIVLIVGGFSIVSELSRFSSESDRLRESIVNEKKAHLKHQVDAAIAGIEYLRVNIESDMREKIRFRVDEAYRRAVQIYEYYKDKLPEKSVKRIITESLRYDTFFKGRGYYYIFNTTGIDILYPIEPAAEGKNSLYKNFKSGKFPMLDIIDSLRNKDRTFYTYYWQKPNSKDTKIYNKTAYLRKLPFYNWIVGTGDYLDDIEIELQKKAIEKIKEIKYDEFGYVFVNTFDGKALVIHSDKYKVGDDITDIVDPDGVHVFEEELKAVKQKEGGYIRYKWFEPSLKRYMKNLTYVRGVPEWGWMLGAFTDLTLVDNIIETNKAMLYKDLMTRVFYIILLLIVISFCILILSSRIRNRLDKKFLMFYSELKSAIRKNTVIDVGKFSFEESIQLSEQTNIILGHKNEITQRLKNREKFLQTLINNLPLTVFYKNLDGVYTGCNKEYCRFIGKNEEDIVGKSLYEVFEKTQADRFKKADNELFAKGGIQVYDTEMTAADGSIRNVNFHKTLYYDSNGKVAGMLGVMIDVTKRVKNEETLLQNQQKLKELNNTKDRFFSIIAHDLRNPFNSLLGVLELLIEEYDELDDNTRMEYLAVVNSSSNNLYKLLDNLLQWSRMQTSKIDFVPTEVSMVDMINTEIDLLKEQAGAKEITIEFKPINDVKATVDGNMISTVVRNLISNAIKFTRNTGKINVELEEAEDNITFSVQDNGVGIYKGDLKKLFNITNKISTYGTNKEAGTGLGLILCKEFIDKHRGNITVSSELNVGTCFKVFLPK